MIQIHKKFLVHNSIKKNFLMSNIKLDKKKFKKVFNQKMVSQRVLQMIKELANLKQSKVWKIKKLLD